LCWKANSDALLNYPNLEVVQSVGAGVEHIHTLQGLTDKITICRLVDTNLSNDMWEYLLAAVLGHMRDFSFYSINQQSKKWNPKPYPSIKEKQIGIMGLGEIGGHVAKQFATMGFNVRGWSGSKKNIQGVESFDGNQFDEFLNGVDILINILPLTPQTQNILDRQNLSKLNKHAYVINVGRGNHLVEEDLIELLEEGFLSGAMLDVFKTEPLPESHPFWNHPTIQITPHIASETNLDSATDLIVENYKRLISNQALLHVVSQVKGY
jgi:glyoxylate/hydroxypyruvate reductase A